MNEKSEMENQCLHRGGHLALHCLNGWEYATRVNASGVVGIIATTDENKLILVVQFRTPVSASVLELPAGLVGDVSPETFDEAARREILEETGYVAQEIEQLFTGPSSAGLTDEVVRIVRAKGLSLSGEGGGVDGESILVHKVPLVDLERFIADFEQRHGLVDFKVRLASALLKGVS